MSCGNFYGDLYFDDLDFVENFDEYTCGQCAYFARDKGRRIGLCCEHGWNLPKDAEACPDFQED